MAQVITTLKKKGDISVDIYPNIKAENVPNNAIDENKIADNSITTNKIVDASITTNKILDSAVTTNKILDSAVTGSKITDASITNIKIVDNSITKNKLNVIKKKYNVVFDLADTDLSSYDVDGGAAYFEMALNEYVDATDFIDSMDEDYNYSKGGYFIYNGNNYVIIEANKTFNGGIECISLFGITPTLKKRVYIPTAVFETIATLKEISTSNL